MFFFRFSVIPLSTNSGLIGWVPMSDTLHKLIRDYRDKKRVVLNLEHRIMLKMTGDYEHLPLLNKVEVGVLDFLKYLFFLGNRYIFYKKYLCRNSNGQQSNL